MSGTTDIRAAAEEALRLHEAATPGDWVHSPPGVDEPHVSTRHNDGPVSWIASPRSVPSRRWHDAAFIARARTLLPVLARAVIARADVASLRGATLEAAARYVADTPRRIATSEQERTLIDIIVSGIRSLNPDATNRPAPALTPEVERAIGRVVNASAKRGPITDAPTFALHDAVLGLLAALAKMQEARAALTDERARMIVWEMLGEAYVCAQPRVAQKIATAIQRAAAGEFGEGQASQAPAIAPGARVRTADPLTAHRFPGYPATSRRAGAEGHAAKTHSGGEGWFVRHDDGTEAPYDADELTVIPVTGASNE